MEKQPEIIHVSNNQIDRRKWDACIFSAFNGIVYAYSWYLDVTCEAWEALITADYSAVMPLTCGKKYGIDYLYQPIFTQQLGVFTIQKLSPGITGAFLNHIPKKYRYIDINMNTFNKTTFGGFVFNERKTYELDMIETYAKNRQNYTENTRRNIQKALRNSISISAGITPTEVVDMLKNTVGDTRKLFNEEHYHILHNLIATTIKHGSGEMIAAHSQRNELIASAFFTRTHTKIIFIAGSSTEQGKNEMAMFRIMDHVIKVNSEKHYTLDFEGSRVPGLARFYSGFGAKACTYNNIKKNDLPWLLRLFKR